MLANSHVVKCIKVTWEIQTLEKCACQNMIAMQTKSYMNSEWHVHYLFPGKNNFRKGGRFPQRLERVKTFSKKRTQSELFELTSLPFCLIS